MVKPWGLISGSTYLDEVSRKLILAHDCYYYNLFCDTRKGDKYDKFFHNHHRFPFRVKVMLLLWIWILLHVKRLQPFSMLLASIPFETKKKVAEFHLQKSIMFLVLMAAITNFFTCPICISCYLTCWACCFSILSYSFVPTESGKDRSYQSSSTCFVIIFMIVDILFVSSFYDYKDNILFLLLSFFEK